ncbi:DUF6985 domain-containing protein [Priestia koreensis]|uniref:Cytoplasmic protein n=1 Tax=Priestia koreensis TaxID=284581 RepID=A0A0M0L0D1_9BACI|nr:DUF2004 domain-containing protein [Priestia koreensis]KOO44337.1 cytoplasmic protein [Priestia koreensis]MCM3005233.1 DUF2004 domain-containing protein [Priestia koreensis]
MNINDPIFGELEYEYGWVKDLTVYFFGRECEISLMVDGEENGEFSDEQYAAYQALMLNWAYLQQNLLQSIVEYYKQKRHELGYDIEVNDHYPPIETQDQLIEMITLDGIVVPYADIFDERDIGMTFNCTWDIENGVGIRLLNEKVAQIGYQDVAI